MKANITYKSQPIGEACVRKQGLYYSFDCRCKFPNAGIYRLWVNSGNKKVKLGVCVPVDDFFLLSTLVPTERFPDENMTIYALNSEDKDEGPQWNAEHFWLDKLDNAVLIDINGTPEVQIINQSPVQSDSDQIP